MSFKKSLNSQNKRLRFYKLLRLSDHIGRQSHHVLQPNINSLKYYIFFWNIECSSGDSYIKEVYNDADSEKCTNRTR